MQFSTYCDTADVEGTKHKKLSICFSVHAMCFQFVTYHVTNFIVLYVCEWVFRNEHTVFRFVYCTVSVSSVIPTLRTGGSQMPQSFEGVYLLPVHGKFQITLAVKELCGKFRKKKFGE